MGEKGNPLASMSDIPDYVASLTAAYTVYKESQARKEDGADREAERGAPAAPPPPPPPPGRAPPQA